VRFVVETIDKVELHIFFIFHFPCLNRIALAAAIDDSAIAIDANTPFDFMPNGFAST